MEHASCSLSLCLPMLPSMCVQGQRIGCKLSHRIISDQTRLFKTQERDITIHVPCSLTSENSTNIHVQYQHVPSTGGPRQHYTRQTLFLASCAKPSVLLFSSIQSSLSWSKHVINSLTGRCFERSCCVRCCSINCWRAVRVWSFESISSSNCWKGKNTC